MTYECVTCGGTLPEEDRPLGHHPEWSTCASALRSRAERAEAERDRDLADMRRFQAEVIRLTNKTTDLRADLHRIRKERDKAKAKAAQADALAGALREAMIALGHIDGCGCHKCAALAAYDAQREGRP